jgi:Insertion element 4 transposase N-terminal/Transposase DDE domain
MEQGRCTLPTEPGMDVLDRLAGLSQVIGREQIRQALDATGRVNPRACQLTHEVVLWIVLAMGLLTELPIRQVFKAARRLRLGEHTPCRSSLCMARKRLGVAPVRHLYHQAVHPLATANTPGAFYKGFRLVGIDGTMNDIPDTEVNARIFGRPSNSVGDGAFPQIRKLSLVELGTHAELGMVLKPCWRGEPNMVAGLRRYLHPGMLVLWDRGFFSYELWQMLGKRGVQILARTKSSVILKPICTLPDGSYLAKIYPGAYDRAKDRNGIVVRVIRYTLDDPQRTGHGEEHVLITTLLDADTYPALELILLYHERWEHELVYDEQKTHQDPRRATKPAQVRSETPAGVVQEMYALSLGHFVTRALMVEAARPLKLDVDRLSFLGCLQILRCRLPECDSSTPETLAAWYRGLLWEMGQEQIEVRRNRINPRVVKRKIKKFMKKRPHHRPAPRLRKRFIESVVMLN